MDYTAALKTLNGLHKYRLPIARRDPSASAKSRTKRWLEILGISEEKLREMNFIHVAGTKGKGTTCLYCESMLSAYQSTKGTSLKIGCLTSPHLTNIRERIRLDSSPISQQLFAAHFSRVWHVVKSAQEDSSSPAVPGYPGFLSLLAIYIFVQEKVDIAIIETGIGGERDSTNVIPCPLATGIATIGLDHVNTLGDTIESIAWHKSGIFKKDSPAFTVHQEDSVLEVLQNRATEKRVSGELCVVPEHLAHRFGVTVDPDMPFQRRNASLAIALTEASLKRLDPDFSMTARLARRLETTKLPGRSETIRQGKFEWYISSAHNELSIEVAAAWFKEAAKHPEHAMTPRVLIFSHESKRDSTKLLKALHKTLYQDGDFSLSNIVFCSDVSGLVEEKLDFFDPRRQGVPTLDSPRRHVAIWDELEGRAEIVVVATVKDAVESVKSKHAHSGAMAFVVGSLYQAGAASVVLADAVALSPDGVTL